MTVCRTKKEWFCFPEGKKPFLFLSKSSVFHVSDFVAL